MTGRRHGAPTGHERRARGIYVIPWHAVDVDGTAGHPPRSLALGQQVTLRRWPQRLDAPDTPPLPGNLRGTGALQARAARIARFPARHDRPAGGPVPGPADPESLLSGGMILSDGHTAYACALLGRDAPLLAFHGRSPAPGTSLRIDRLDAAPAPAPAPVPAHGPATVCFAAGTPIATPQGPRNVETLGEGDLVLTRDNGPMPLRWRGRQHLGAERLEALPALRPIRIRAGALGPDSPDGDLLLSPEHRVLVCARAAEVLVRAGALRDLPGVGVERCARGVTYVHLAFDGHQILRAAGLPVESFDAAGADLRALGGGDRARLFQTFPELCTTPGTWGAPARRVLTTSEAEILRQRLH